jgi:NADPH-dependent methylglyoxal reductase
MSTILVTGATGFIAGQVIADLLNHGHKVVGTVRQLSKASKLQEAFPEAHKSGKLTFATLSDVRSQDELKAIFASHPEIAVVMHTASPFFYNSEDVVKDLLEPALEGIRSVLQVTQDAATTCTRWC